MDILSRLGASSCRGTSTGNSLVFTTKFGNAIDIPTLTKQWFKPALVKAELPLNDPTNSATEDDGTGHRDSVIVIRPK